MIIRPYMIICVYGRDNCNCCGALVTGNYKHPLDDHATFPRIFGAWIFGNDSETPYLWDCHLVGDKSGIAFPADVVGVLYPVALVNDWVNWVDGDGNVDCRVGGGGTRVVGGAKIIARATVKVATKLY